MKPLIIVSAATSAVALGYFDHELVGFLVACAILLGGYDLTKGDRK